MFKTPEPTSSGSHSPCESEERGRGEGGGVYATLIFVEETNSEYCSIPFLLFIL